VSCSCQPRIPYTVCLPARGRSPQAAARRAGLEHEEKVLTDSINTANKTASARVKYRQLPQADLEAERGTCLASRWSADHSQLSWSLLVSGAVLYSDPHG
jgi:hypothetical protein